MYLTKITFIAIIYYFINKQILINNKAKQLFYKIIKY